MPGWGHTEFLSKGQGTYCGSKPSLRGKEWIPQSVSCAHNQARWPSWKAARQQGRALATSTALPYPEVWGPPGTRPQTGQGSKRLAPKQIRHPELHEAHQVPPPLPQAAVIYQHALGMKSCCRLDFWQSRLGSVRAPASVPGGREDEGQWSLKTPLVATSCRIPQSCHTEPQRQRHPRSSNR